MPVANTPGQTLALDLGAVKTVHAVQVNYADHESGIYAESPDIRTRFRILWSADGEAWDVFADLMDSERDRPNAYVEGGPVEARFIRYEHGEVAAANLAIGDLRVFGTGEGPPPATPAEVSVARSNDGLNATVQFDRVPGALGYNVRWGVAPDRLFLTYQVWDDAMGDRGELEVRALNAGVDYWFAVEAFSLSGVSGLSEPAAVDRPLPSSSGERSETGGPSGAR